jgi:glycolate oxidase FAD binding subunit
MSVATRSMAEALASLVGAAHVTGEASALARAALDGRAPRWVVRPGSIDEVARVMRLAWEEGLVVVPRGSGSTLELGHPVQRVDVALDLRRLDAVVEYNPDDLTVTTQAGISAGALAERLAARRQFLPVDPPGAARRTLGGIAATNASGPLRARYGTLRDLVLGVRFVQADGVPTWGGARVVKSVSGYDIPKLMVGALGTLGVLVELTLRLHPMPEHEATSLVTFPDVDRAASFVDRVLDSVLQPSRLEFLNAAALARCGGGPRAAAAVAVSLATVEAAVREQERVVGEFAARAGGAAQAAEPGFWDAYDRLLTADRQIALRVAALVTCLAATVREVERAVAGPGAAAVTGCCALGALRVSLPATSPAAAATVERIRAVVSEGGGSVVVERAPRELRATVDPWGPLAAETLELMRGVKQAFDAKGILNPGRFVGGL